MGEEGGEKGGKERKGGRGQKVHGEEEERDK